MKIVTLIARILLGLAFVVFGLNAFLQFMKMGPMPAGLAGDFMKAIFMSGYFYAVAVCQILGGLMLLSGRFAALGLVIVGPVIVNILLFHTFLAHNLPPPAIAVTVLGVFLMWAYRDRFAGLFKA
ncbi:MAG TPA: hypothetical protein VHY22_16330 [Chthoniobacteraceae bacterium]|jgi:uncharacterized membrane protein YphA (DoxX/SURF4 family)|nr:hypothetical protein [Chthoniobacteraceae bacterium]